MRTTPGSFAHVWTIPLSLAALTVFGLLCALLGTDAWWVVAWICLAAPVLTIAYFGWPRRRQGRD